MKNYKYLINKSQCQLSDKDYLERFIDDLHLFRNYEFCGVKDITSTHLAITQSSAKMHGFKNVDAVIGTNDYELKCKVSEFADMLRNQDNKAIQTKSKVYVLDTHEFATGFSSVCTIKKPIINPATSKVLGTFWVVEKFCIDNNLKSILEIHKIRFGNNSSMEISNNLNKFKLSDIEQDVLFCVSLGMSNRKDIACLLSIVYKREISAETTVNDAFRRLYQKLDCNSLTQLIAFAEYNNLNLEIPKNFLPTGSYIIS